MTTKPLHIATVGLLCVLFGFYQGAASADIYRWTDSSGKVRYSDKKPKVPAEDITATVSKQNIDTSGEEHQKLETIFRKENAADHAYQAQQERRSVAAEQRCHQAKITLDKLAGRVLFIGSDGKPVKVTEQEREQREQEMRKFIADNCSS